MRTISSEDHGATSIAANSNQPVCGPSRTQPPPMLGPRFVFGGITSDDDQCSCTERYEPVSMRTAAFQASVGSVETWAASESDQGTCVATLRCQLSRRSSVTAAAIRARAT